MTYDHSPADIVRHMLQDLTLVTDPNVRGAWPCHVAKEPDTPDDVVTLYDVAGRGFGSNQLTGQVSEMPGVLVRVRSANQRTGWKKIAALANALDEDCALRTVAISGDDQATYTVNSVTRISNPLSLGNNPPSSPGTTAPSSNRWIFTLSVFVSITQED